MSGTDIVLVSIIGLFGAFGFWFGFIHTLGSLLGNVLGAYLASRYFEPLADFLITITHWSGNFARIVAFIFAFIVINRLVGFVFWLIDRAASLITRLPFIHSLDQFLGLILGLIEGIVSLGLIIFFIERIPLSQLAMQHLADSVIAPSLSKTAAILWPLLPDAIRLLRSTIDYVANRVL